MSDSVALGLPSEPSDLAATLEAISTVKRGEQAVEIRLGVGPISLGRIPARVFGHAACVATALESDLPILIGNPGNVGITIFSSAPKAGVEEVATNFLALQIFGWALRFAGITFPIRLDFAAPQNEIPARFGADISHDLRIWLERAAENSGNATCPIRYAMEHAAESMFSDIVGSDNSGPLHITVGCVPEARFWAVRNVVREAAGSQGMNLAPAAILILKGCRIPWYNSTANEPVVSDLVSPEIAIQKLKAAANPGTGGNAGLTREYRAFKRLTCHPKLSQLIKNLVNGTLDTKGGEFKIGPTLATQLVSE